MGAQRLQASGLQIAFLIFAVVLLGAPAEKYLGPLIFSDGVPAAFARLFFFVPAVALLALIPALRRICKAELARAIGNHKREVGVVVVLNAFVPFAIGGAIVLWHWTMGGEMALARRLGQEQPPSAAMEYALSHAAIIFALFSVTLGPVVEELVFRGMLFRAWEVEWGWVKAMIASSIVFAAYHPVPFAAFMGSMIYTTLYRRTGSIRSAMLAHCVHNGLLWYPLMGRFYFNAGGKETGEIELWTWHLVALAVLAIALPIYVWMARDRDDAATVMHDTCAART